MHFCSKLTQYSACIWYPRAPLLLVVLFYSRHGHEEETGVHAQRNGGGRSVMAENMTKDTWEAPLYLSMWNEVLKFNGAQGDSRFFL